MNKGRFVVFLLLSFLFNLPLVANQTEPSSAIPDVRKFELNKSANPCDNFHAYVCSNVEQQFKLRDDRSAHVFAFDDSHERILEKKKDFFKNIENEKSLSPRSAQFRNYYRACMNEKAAAAEERELVKQLATEMGRIKTIEQFVDLNRENLLNEKWSVMSYQSFPNTDNPLAYDITFDVNLMGLPEHSYYDNEELVKEFVNLMKEFFDTVYPLESKEEHLARARAIVDFEKKFKETYPLPAAFRQRYTQPRKVARTQFLQNISKMQLKEFFEKNIPKKTEIRDFIPESVAFLQENLKQENLQVLKDMYVYRSARGFMDDAYPELFKKRWDFRHKYLGGPLTRSDRQERCTSSVMDSFEMELDQEMLPRLFPDFPKSKMNIVAEKIRKSIIDGIKANSWLSEQSKRGAIEKITTAKLQLVKPVTAKEWDFRPIVNLDSEKPYKNSRLLALAGHKEVLKDLREGVNQLSWGMGPLTVNAYYSPDKNKFVLPIGILQHPFFIKDGDVIENLGAVGSVVGHELGHAIDDQGAQFDSKGRLRQWMSEDDVKKFQERGQKLISQFNSIGHNGQLTQGENVADLVGLSFAYNAAFPENKGTMSDKQKFFVAYARVWCSVMREKTAEMQLKTDPHSLGFARINEQVKHQAGFAEAYSCNEKNKLYLKPEDRIQVW